MLVAGLVEPAIDRSSIITAKPVQVVVPFGPQHPDDRLGWSALRGYYRRINTTHTGPHSVYEVKHDGFRSICRRDCARECVFSRPGHAPANPGPLPE